MSIQGLGDIPLSGFPHFFGNEAQRLLGIKQRAERLAATMRNLAPAQEK